MSTEIYGNNTDGRFKRSEANRWNLQGERTRRQGKLKNNGGSIRIKTKLEGRVTGNGESMVP
jgi:cytoskeletal protein CcmA (bactofilin family)